MFDNEINKILKPMLNPLGVFLLNHNVKANQVTFFGFICGLCCFLFVANGFLYIALFFFLLNRFLDGLDGCLARQLKASDLGGFYDIIGDLIIYSLIPLGFIIYDKNNALSFAFLLASFIGTSSSFLASAWIIEKNKLLLNLNYKKSFFYSRGIAEGFETIIFFILIFIFSDLAFLFAWIFGIICWITVILRVINIALIFSKIDRNFKH